MDKYSRNSRITGITKILVEHPNKVINLNHFTEMFNSAKSTISEDLLVVRDTLSKFGMGRIETVPGAAGGIKFINGISEEEKLIFLDDLSNKLMEKDRIIPGNFLYMLDIMYNPEIIHKAGLILASSFDKMNVDYILTVETKGIPLAYEVARLLGIQLIIVRRDSKVTEGPTVSINYVSGSTNRIQTMSLSKRALKKNSGCIFIDDFMKAGGTALGIIDLLKEFESQLLGIGVLVDSFEAPKKLVHNYISLIQFNGIGEDGRGILKPTPKID
jgi:purine operon repressor